MQTLVWLCVIQFKAIQFGTSYANLNANFNPYPANVENMVSS